MTRAAGARRRWTAVDRGMLPTAACSQCLRCLPLGVCPPNPQEALDAYRSLFAGPVLMGVEVPPEAWGGNVITLAAAEDLARYVRSTGGGGMMIWSLQKGGVPSAQQLSSAICNILGLGSCAAPLFP